MAILFNIDVRNKMLDRIFRIKSDDDPVAAKVYVSITDGGTTYAAEFGAASGGKINLVVNGEVDIPVAKGIVVDELYIYDNAIIEELALIELTGDDIGDFTDEGGIYRLNVLEVQL